MAVRVRPVLAPRETRLLPISGKSGGALRDVAGRYLEWLDGQGATLGAEVAASDPLLSDMAWLAGVVWILAADRGAWRRRWRRSRESEKFRGYDNEWRSRNSRIAAVHSSGFSSWRKCVVSGMKS